MSAVTQNFKYEFGKKRSGKSENVISSEKLAEIKASLDKYLTDKKK